ncbi:MAG TPA: amidohydrolase, partial [Actinomycetota bacterium]|nr:amidohydrolase [Actinomycetota bacterium]
MADLKASVKERITGLHSDLIEVSHKMYAEPELAYEEVRSAELLCELLEGNGMTVERSAHGLKTAFRATAGTSGPHVI